MRKLLIATRSKGKLPEIIARLRELNFEFLNLNDIAELPKKDYYCDKAYFPHDIL